jgi:hypothetical protein
MRPWLVNFPFVAAASGQVGKLLASIGEPFHLTAATVYRAIKRCCPTLMPRTIVDKQAMPASHRRAKSRNRLGRRGSRQRRSARGCRVGEPAYPHRIQERMPQATYRSQEALRAIP